MVMNFVLSFCKITGASKIFSRNFYLPLLKPLTPKDALRTFRITGKWLLGSKIQHYIPVLFNHKRARSAENEDYGKVVFNEKDSCMYMTPVLDSENENHQMLLNMLNNKEEQGMFVYKIDDKRCNLVFSRKMELAIRDGDIIDVMVSQRDDKIIIKLRNFKKIPVPLEYFNNKGKRLYQGEGATTAEEEKFHHHGKYTMSLAKIFEARDQDTEEWEFEIMRLAAKRKRQTGEGTKEWNEMLQTSIENLDWDQFERDAKNVIETIFEPVEEQHIGMEVDDFEKTKDVEESIMTHRNDILDKLPTMSEIPDVIKNLPNAILDEFEVEIDIHDASSLNQKITRVVSGVNVKLSSGKECFVIGQMVKTEEGDVFVPGQTIENEFGVEYAPGITINMDNKPTLITGLILGEEENNNAMFLPSESTITADGQLTFTTNAEERPLPQPNNFPKDESIFEVLENEGQEENDFVPQVIADTFEEESTMSDISIENEDDIEALKLKEQEHKLELERLRRILIDDGMEEIIATLEMKKRKIKERLSELQKLSVKCGNNLVTYINENDAKEVAERITNNPDYVHKISEILLTMTHRATTFPDKRNIDIQNISNPSLIYNNTFVTDADKKFNICPENLKIMLKTGMVTAANIFKTRPKDQVSALTAIGEVFEVLKDEENLQEEICRLMETATDRNEICTVIMKQLTQKVSENKVEMLKSVIKENEKDNPNKSVIVEKLIQTLEKGEDILGQAFKKVSENNQEILNKVINTVKEQINKVKTENRAVECLQNAIVSSVKAISEQNYKEFVMSAGEEQIKEFVAEAIGFSRALGLQGVTENLSNLSLESEINVLAANSASTDILKRVIIIRQLAADDFLLRTALKRLRKNPESAKSDQRVRQLVRESAILTSHSFSIKTSRDIPQDLFDSQNFLAIEDFLIQRTRMDNPILISKRGMQAVIPRDASRDVLAGKVPYVLIDETGMTNFKPLHVFSALKLNKNREKRFEDFLCVGAHERLFERKMSEPAKNRHYGPKKVSEDDVLTRLQARRMSLNNSRMVA